MKLTDIFEDTSDTSFADESSQIAFGIANPHKIPYMVRKLDDIGLTLSERVQLELCKHDGKILEHIIDAGIIPSEEVQRTACYNHGLAIFDIISALDKINKKPSEEVQRIACLHNGYAIEYIIDARIKPTENVQLAACTSMGDAILYITEAGIKPTERVQLAACTSMGDSIEYIIDAGIIPSEAVQRAACTNSGNAIEHILKAGIIPTDDIIDLSFDDMLKDNQFVSDIFDVLDVENDFILPNKTQEKVSRKYPKLLAQFPNRFTYIIKSLVDNLRTTLETHKYPLEHVYTFIEAAYPDDEDTVATLKHRANAIQRKLDERNKYK